jgi:excisionase family DNA binding protein
MASRTKTQNPESNPTRPLIPQVANGLRKTRRTEKLYPTDSQLSRLLERRRALELGYELPLNTEEAALFVGFNSKTVERMARSGEIPAHPASGICRKTWKFYPSELDEWLRAKVNSHRYPCSPNGKDSDS